MRSKSKVAPEYGIYRVENVGTDGYPLRFWLFAISRQRQGIKRNFQDGIYGSEASALLMAQSYREAVRRALGLTKDTPGEIAKRLEMLVLGAVSPVLTLPQAVKLAEAFPVEFLVLTNEITALTGKGADLVKPAAASPQTTV